MANLAETSKHPILVGLITTLIGTGITFYLTTHDKTKDQLANSQAAAEKAYWEDVEKDGSEERYCDYLLHYPHGTYQTTAHEHCAADALADRRAEKAEAAAQ